MTEILLRGTRDKGKGTLGTSEYTKVYSGQGRLAGRDEGAGELTECMTKGIGRDRVEKYAGSCTAEWAGLVFKE